MLRSCDSSSVGNTAPPCQLRGEAQLPWDREVKALGTPGHPGAPALVSVRMSRGLWLFVFYKRKKAWVLTQAPTQLTCELGERLPPPPLPHLLRERVNVALELALKVREMPLEPFGGALVHS